MPGIPAIGRSYKVSLEGSCLTNGTVTKAEGHTLRVPDDHYADRPVVEHLTVPKSASRLCHLN